VLGITYDLFLITFGVGVWGSADRRRGLRATAGLLVAIGAIGPFWPPMHMRGTVVSLTDTLHIAFAAVTSLFILLAVGFASTAFGKRFRLYSIVTIVVLLVFGTLTSLDGPRIAANLRTPWVGVTERIDVGAYVLWVAVLATMLLRIQAPTLTFRRSNQRTS
jgi:hypothetical protein